MCFRKNGVSYSVWLIFIMSNCVVFSFLGMLCARLFTDSFPVVGMGLIAAFFALMFLVYVLTGIAAKKISVSAENAKKRNAESLKKRLIVEGILVIVILAVGVGIRIHMLPMAGESAAYYDVAKISQDTAELIVPVQNSVYYYLCLLRGMFLLLGNHWLAGIWLQIILQILGCVVLYFVVRKMGGVFAAIAVLAFTMFSVSNIREGLSYSPQMLYTLFWSLGLLFVMLYLNASTKCGEKETVGYSITMWLTVILLAILVGFLGYVDVSGFVLMIPVFLLPMVCRESKAKAVWIGRALLGVFSIVGSFFGFLYLDSVLSNASFIRIMNAWLTTFKMETPDVVTMLQSSSPEVIILLVIMAMNIFSFYRRKSTEVVTVWILMTFAMAVLYVMGITTESMNGRPLLLVLMSVVAAISVKELFAVTVTAEKISDEADMQIIELDQKEKTVIAEKPEKSENVVMTERSEISNKSELAEKPTKPRFIENPLPLPKKHVKKNMDYAFVPEAAQMKYDVDVKETDDFDV